MLRSLPPSVAERLARLAQDQRDAAVAPPGPILCVAPAGSGKTTTLVARVAWLIASGAAAAGEIAAITFNKRAAEELRERLAGALAPLGVSGDAGDAVRVRTFHALGREILRDAGVLQSEKQGKEVYFWINKAFLIGAMETVVAYIRRNA